ncbi:RNA-binding protein Musashi homolog [Seminavis robusta]|uniref:Meiosis regulator and mRNA stability factor 1 n=1 Tax=Seminavis robusta TaxID=568900 RepID=A0A9N8DVJ6_9STRA|nr:RNA-binding protein Musashi homolog [Seminavis robusta]|eukprot:Sro384_g131430.1 RNA-binding protein Musashi homolog (614) ;mRNA; r:21485-23392
MQHSSTLFRQSDHGAPAEFPVMGTADVAVFWDFENVRIPAWCPTSTATEEIRNKVAKYGRIVEKRLYYDSRQPTESTAPRTELDLSGFTLVDCPSRNRKETLDKKLIVDMLCFAWERASRGAKACVVLITSDGDYSYALARLRDIGVFTVIIYRPDVVAKVLIDNANVVMSWEYDCLGGPPRTVYEDEEHEMEVQTISSNPSQQANDDNQDDMTIYSQPVEDQGRHLNDHKSPRRSSEDVGDVTSFDSQSAKGRELAGQFEAVAKDEICVNTAVAIKKMLRISDDQQQQTNSARNDANSGSTDIQPESVPCQTKQPRPMQDVAASLTVPEVPCEAQQTSTTGKNQLGNDVPKDTGGEQGFRGTIGQPSSPPSLHTNKQTSTSVKTPNLETKGKFAIFCSVVLNAQHQNVKEGISVYSSWASEGCIGSAFYAKVGEKDREGFLRIRTLASEKNFVEWGRRNLAVPGKPVIKVKGRDDKPEGSSTETYLRLTYSGLAILNVAAKKDDDWHVVTPRTNKNSAKQLQQTEDDNPNPSPVKTKTGKLFIGGLAWQTTEDSLRSYFLQFGSLQSVFVMYGNGWGFVLFSNASDAERVLARTAPHIVDQKSVDVKPFTKH